MKHLSRFLLASLLVLGFSTANAQDENNPWAVSIGVNAVDIFPTGGDLPVQGGIFDEYFNVSDHWNMLPSVSKLAVSRYVGDGFTFTVAGTVNKIDKVGEFEDGTPAPPRLGARARARVWVGVGVGVGSESNRLQSTLA